MSPVITWVKSNVYTCIFIVVMIAAAVTMPIVAGKMNASVREENESRANKLSQIEKIRKTQVGDLEANVTTLLVNDKAIQHLRERVEAQGGDADAVFEAAIEHNRKGRGVLNTELFPDPPPSRVEVLPKLFHEELTAAYDDLLSDVRAGTPPDAAVIAEFLERRQEQFLSSNLAGEGIDSLSDEDRAQLVENMTGARVGRYVEKAQDMKFYASADVLGLPMYEQRRYDQWELFDWQWNYWVHEDLLRGIEAANAKHESVVDAPVKRIISVGIRVGEPLGAPSAAPSGGGGGGGTGMTMGFGSGGGGGGGGGAANKTAAPATPLNPSAEAVLNYAESISGRSTNPLYDVRYIDIDMVVDPTRIPEVLDALARRNFITVVQLNLTEADPFAALREGYFYGTDRVAELSLTLETIWLRPWVTEFMPTTVKEQLGIPLQSSEENPAG
ncbi:MAG: hypothetical protein ACYTGR_14955 [Planctomycetota bacterium]|jgi:hypothetical protein